MLYRAPVSDDREAYYLTAVFNSESTRARVEKWQSQGQWGARHFDKVVFNLPIPKFNPKVQLHLDIAQAAEEAEKIAKAVPVTPEPILLVAARPLAVNLRRPV
jgi:hypothetical protein